MSIPALRMVADGRQVVLSRFVQIVQCYSVSAADENVHCRWHFRDGLQMAVPHCAAVGCIPEGSRSFEII